MQTCACSQVKMCEVVCVTVLTGSLPCGTQSSCFELPLLILILREMGLAENTRILETWGSFLPFPHPALSSRVRQALNISALALRLESQWSQLPKEAYFRVWPLTRATQTGQLQQPRNCRINHWKLGFNCLIGDPRAGPRASLDQTVCYFSFILVHLLVPDLLLHL